VSPAGGAAIDAIFKIESARLVAVLAAMVRDLGVAEELAQDTLLAALEHWPEEGIPDKPGAWLMTAGKNRALDWLRRAALMRRKQLEMEADPDTGARAYEPDFAPRLDEQLDDPIGDELLRLMFTACHPLLSPEARLALTLRLLGGLSTAEIARACLVPEATIAQRIVRAKRTLSESGVAFELPPPEQLAERLASVLHVVYLMFNEGYAASAGEDWMRPRLCEEALRLGRVLVALAPDEPEALGLLALMELQFSRRRARQRADGSPVLLLEQDRSLWDPLLIRRGLAGLLRAESLSSLPGSYRLQAAIAACHARARKAADTDWARIAGLYATLEAHTGSPVVRLNRAVAVGMSEGPAAGLALIEPLLADARLAQYPQLPAVRGDLLEKLGRRVEACAAFERAAALTANQREQALMRARAAALAG
jgi:RNA polymerase sigma factor (sigma-70 family)